MRCDWKGKMSWAMFRKMVKDIPRDHTFTLSKKRKGIFGE
jgi:hypothetical protein